MTTGEKIRKARLDKGLTQEELGKLIGVQKAAINKYETGAVVNLKRSTIAKLAAALDVKGSWLICDEEEKPSTVADLDDEEQMLIYCWRQATPEIKENIAFALRSYGMPRPQGKKETEYSISHGA